MILPKIVFLKNLKVPLFRSNALFGDGTKLYNRLCIFAYSSLGMQTSELTSTGYTEELISKIIYNDILHKYKNEFDNEIRKERKNLLNREKESLEAGQVPKMPSLIVKNIFQNRNMSENEEDRVENTSSKVHFPYEFQESVLDNSKDDTGELVEYPEATVEISSLSKIRETRENQRKRVEVEDPQHWLSDGNSGITLHDERFGSSDPNIPISSVPCGGCGALLHCTNPEIPGFMPKEVFIDLDNENLRSHLCQRCLFLNDYNIALGINTRAEEYEKIIGRIRNIKALVILMVDLLDFPCSIWPNIHNVIGHTKPMYVVGNKVDLLVQDGRDCAQHWKKCLQEALITANINMSNVVNTAMISAKTGFGIEELISDINSRWDHKGDIYIIGCTNVGKSTLFNALIQSDFCKVKAIDLLQRATVSHWPGTTLNLLKFPILRQSSWRSFVRKNRLLFDAQNKKSLKEICSEVDRPHGVRYQVNLTGYIGRSYRQEENVNANVHPNLLGLDPNDPDFKQSKWCYDTPGVVHEAQILNLLTTYELSKVLPRSRIVPRNFRLTQGMTLFIGGIARLDLINAPCKVWFTVNASMELPITIVKTEDANEMYRNMLGTYIFAVPQGNAERMKKWPPLESKEFQVCGKLKHIASSDIILSSAGWTAITLDPGYACKIVGWTPGGRGLYMRNPALVRYSISFKGKRITGTPAYQYGLQYADKPI